MLHKAWNSKGEMLYCFPRSSIKFQGHTVQNITDFDPNWAFPDYRPVAAFKSLRFALLCRLHFILLEVFKCLKKINPKCMNNLFEVKQHDHCLRDGTRLLQPKVRTTTHGLRTISYLGAKLWNDLPVHMKNIHHMDPYEFKSMLLLWEGPNLFSMYQCYMWDVK